MTIEKTSVNSFESAVLTRRWSSSIDKEATSRCCGWPTRSRGPSALAAGGEKRWTPWSRTRSNFARDAQNPVPLPSGRQPGPLPGALTRGTTSMRRRAPDRKRNACGRGSHGWVGDGKLIGSSHAMTERRLSRRTTAKKRRRRSRYEVAVAFRRPFSLEGRWIDGARECSDCLAVEALERFDCQRIFPMNAREWFATRSFVVPMRPQRSRVRRHPTQRRSPRRKRVAPRKPRNPLSYFASDQAGYSGLTSRATSHCWSATAFTNV